jgi:hypothetical protein
MFGFSGVATRDSPEVAESAYFLAGDLDRIPRVSARLGRYDVLECQGLVRPLVKVILVDDHTIRHSIPVPPASPIPSGESRKVESYRLRSRVSNRK